MKLDPSLELHGLSVRARGEFLLQDVNLALREGEFVALLGPNGAGKTTLLRAALGLIASTGDALLGGRDVHSLNGRQRAAIAAWLPQQSAVIEAVTALEFVMAARYRFAESRPSAERAAHEALARTGATEYAARPVTQLSGGEQQRVAVAALLAQEAPLLLLDEPANHLDPAQQIDLYTLIGELWRAGRGILCITHDINLLRHAGSGPGDIRVVGLSSGRVRFATGYGAADLGTHVGALFGVQMHELQSGGHRLIVPRGRSA
jgi:iron complex transport system ATP-binding protein